ncbi:MAG TPA: NAD(P)-binding domain-containing protein [Thermomicrobiales bacterium]|nr:NAD(P)-binding domain-containing protein [Thermomicrobiales bacterium]
MDRLEYPVVVIGAGPVGLAAAAHLKSRAIEPLVIERGSQVAANVAEWGHVRFFSPWRYSVDTAAAALLEAHGWIAPDPESYPTGADLVSRYLKPLAGLPEIQPQLRLQTEVVSVTREGFDKMKTPGREHAPFLVTTRDADGHEENVLARAVIDASGTWNHPNPLGASGQFAIGERPLAEHIAYGIPDVLGAARTRYAGKRVLVVGSGHSAFNVLLDLVDLADSAPGTSITWAIRREGERLGNLFGGGIGDALPARGQLGDRVRSLVEQGRLRLVTGVRITRLVATAEGIVVSGQDSVLEPVDEIIAATGFRPDLGLLSELRLALDAAVESPTALAPLIDPNVHSCGSVPPHGAEELKHPEPDLYIVGMKSYGRAPTFLMLTGYEQVRSVAAAIAGDWEAARDVQLVLPETGVCSTSALTDRGVACCAPASEAASDLEASCCGGGGAIEQDGGGSVQSGACCQSAAPQVIQLAAIGRARSGEKCC